jgi:hypothetical protein
MSPLAGEPWQRDIHENKGVATSREDKTLPSGTENFRALLLKAKV